MEKKSKRMQAVYTLAKNREEEASKIFGASNQDVELQKLQLQDLLRYRDEYQKQIKLEGGRGISAYRLREFQAFLLKMDAAIKQQQLKLDSSMAQQSQKREEWLNRRQKSEALDGLMTRYRLEERQKSDKQEQKEMDEIAQQKYQGH